MNLCMRCDDLFGSCKPLAGKPCAMGHVPAQIQPEPLAEVPGDWATPPGAADAVVVREVADMTPAPLLRSEDRGITWKPEYRHTRYTHIEDLSIKSPAADATPPDPYVRTRDREILADRADDETARRFEADWTSTTEQRKRKWLRGNGIVLENGPRKEPKPTPSGREQL